MQSATVSENTISTEEPTTETTEQTQTEDSTSAEAQNNPENAEEITNQLTDGQTLTHTHQADLSEFENYTGYAFMLAHLLILNKRSLIVLPQLHKVWQVPMTYASVMIAQAIVESGWGNSTLASAPNYNLFGIKGSYNGQSVTMPTSEYVNGQWITVNAAFRKYPSYKESLQDNVTVLKTTSFSQAFTTIPVHGKAIRTLTKMLRLG